MPDIFVQTIKLGGLVNPRVVVVVDSISAKQALIISNGITELTPR
jgi:hypothetical protein